MSVLSLLQWASGLNLIPGLVMLAIGFWFCRREVEEGYRQEEIVARSSKEAAKPLPGSYWLVEPKKLAFSYLLMVVGAWLLSVAMIAIFSKPSEYTYGPFGVLATANLLATLVLVSSYGYVAYQHQPKRPRHRPAHA